MEILFCPSNFMQREWEQCKIWKITLCHPFNGHFLFLWRNPLNWFGLLSNLCPSFNPSMISHSDPLLVFFRRFSVCGTLFCSVVLSALKLFVSTLASESLAVTVLLPTLTLILLSWGLFLSPLAIILRLLRHLLNPITPIMSHRRSGQKLTRRHCTYHIL
jgi:hypothetical protein